MGRNELCEETIREIISTSNNPVLAAFRPVLAASTDTFSNLMFINRDVIITVAAIFAKEEKLHNGATIHYLDDDYRNNNLLFWDAQNEKIVDPFTEYDDYGSVPPIFVVGDGYFSPNDWLDEVDHNSTVFPSSTLIREMKEFAAANPNVKEMQVEINGGKYVVKYDNKFVPEDWDSCIINVEGTRLHISKGRPSWRDEIVEDKP
jgi:hypothetical protein